MPSTTLALCRLERVGCHASANQVSADLVPRRAGAYP